MVCGNFDHRFLYYLAVIFILVLFSLNFWTCLPFCGLYLGFCTSSRCFLTASSICHNFSGIFAEFNDKILLFLQLLLALSQRFAILLAFLQPVSAFSRCLRGFIIFPDLCWHVQGSLWNLLSALRRFVMRCLLMFLWLLLELLELCYISIFACKFFCL